MIFNRKLNSRGFAHAFILLLFVVVFGIAGAYYLVESKADSVSFTLLGTHPQAAAQPTGVGKIIRTLKPFNGKIYAGYGDFGANTGPIAVTPLDPTTNTFSSTPELTQSAEMIGFYRSWNNKLFAPSIDPGSPINSTFSVGALVNGSMSWQQYATSLPSPFNTPYMEHIFDINTLTGTDIWLTGSAGDDALVLRSVDNGVTWKEMLRVPGNGTTRYRFYGSAVLNGKFYVQATSISVATNAVGAPESQSHVFTNEAWSRGSSLITAGWAIGHAEAFAGKLVYFIESPADFIPYSCPLLFNGSGTSTNCPEGMNDFSVVGDTLYALGASSKKVYSTKDLVTWYIQGAAPTSAVSVTALGGKIYVGTNDSKLYSAPVATNPSIAGSTTSGGTTKGHGGGGGGAACHGKKCTSADPATLQ